MKNISILIAIVLIASSCNNPKTNNNARRIVLNDTITTASGLNYIFVKEGKGRKIEVGSEVKSYTDLYLNDADTIFWTTADSQDSIFQFIHGKTSLIKGFSELNNYLHEGDEVIAILPYTLAYGEKGRNGIPPKATLIYNPYIVKEVSVPKVVLADSLFAIVKSESASKALDFYKNVMAGDLKNNYHTSINQMMDLMSKLNKDSLYVESLTIADFFLTETEEAYMREGFNYYKVIALENQGRIEEAIILSEFLSKQEGDQEFWIEKIEELKQKLNK